MFKILAFIVVLIQVQLSMGFLQTLRPFARITRVQMSVRGEQVPLTTAESSMRSLRRGASTAASFSAALAALSALSSVPSAALADAATAATAAPTVPTDAPAKVELGPPPSNFGISQKDYYGDCQQVVNHMRYAVQMEKGNPLLPEVAQKTKDEMNEFVSFYRRYQGISGKQSFSLLYTSVNVLAGHYTSYGVKFPVPEKRRKRLMQEFNDIEKNIRKKR